MGWNGVGGTRRKVRVNGLGQRRGKKCNGKEYKSRSYEWEMGEGRDVREK